jgi:uncharacterized protein (DUF1330 family)
MNEYLTVAFSMAAGVVLGAAAVNALHAEGEPPAFVISEVTVKDQAHYLADFIPAVRKTVTAAGAEAVAHGGKLQTLLGAAPASRIVVIQYPSFEAAQAWWNSQATQDAFTIGAQYAGFRQYLVEGAARR